MATAHLRSPPAGTSTPANVASSITSVTLLAANVNRLGATIYNDSNSRLRVKLGTGASATSFTELVLPYGTYPVLPGYTGIITGLWSTVVSGNARVTEITP